MSRSLSVRKPRFSERRQLHRLLEQPLQAWQRRRAETLLLHLAGVSARDIARILEVHPHTTYADLGAFQRQGLDSIRQPRRQGAPPRLTPAQVATIWRLAETPPYELGRPYGRWSLNKLRAYLLRQRVLKTISREHLRRLLQKGGSPSAACSAN
jgi:transposase